jgi:hypothetical protein
MSFRRCDPVANTLCCDFPFILREGEQYVQHHSTHGRTRIERLCDCDKGHTVLLKKLNQLDKIAQRTCETVDLVDYDDIDFPLLSGPPLLRIDETPLPAAFPMFLGGAGLVGLLSRRRKRKLVAP